MVGQTLEQCQDPQDFRLTQLFVHEQRVTDLEAPPPVRVSTVGTSSTTVLLNNAVLLRPFRGRSSQLALRECATAAAAGDDLGMRHAARTWLHRHEQGGGFAMAGYNNRLALGHPVEEL